VGERTRERTSSAPPAPIPPYSTSAVWGASFYAASSARSGMLCSGGLRDGDAGGVWAPQSFCHTAAYPKPVDVVTHATLPDFIRNRGGVSLRPGDGVIHSWLNRMLLPDTVRVGGCSVRAGGGVLSLYLPSLEPS
jgi:hypothetical protein